MAPSQKRKASTAEAEFGDSESKRRFIDSEIVRPDNEEALEDEAASLPDIRPPADDPTPPSNTEEPEDTPAESSEPQTEAQKSMASRLERLKALKGMKKDAIKANTKATAAEAHRAKQDPALLSNLSRKSAIASHKLLQAETEDAGEDFERKRAWDWTAEESEKWDKRVRKKERNREGVLFSSYDDQAGKVYKKQVKDMKVDIEEYKRQKMSRIERAAAEGRLEIVELESGEMVAVDREGGFMAGTGNATDLWDKERKPSKEAIEKLVNGLKMADRKRNEARSKRLREQQHDGGEDVTYINQKNKLFNEKLKRFYDKYTTDIRESFERGTAI
jgi:pre-mRNA-splicing factor SYF2